MATGTVKWFNETKGYTRMAAGTKNGRQVPTGPRRTSRAEGALPPFRPVGENLLALIKSRRANQTGTRPKSIRVAFGANPMLSGTRVRTAGSSLPVRRI